jgi:hypothetical protein
MKINLIAAGVLAGGIAVAGLTGSAYAASGTAKTGGTAKPSGTAGVVAGAVKGHGPIAIACTGKVVRIKGEPEKTLRIKGKPGKAISIKAPGKLPAPPAGVPVLATHGKALPAPPAGTKVTKLIRVKGKAVVKASKGLHCVQVKPGTPGAPPAVPAR